MEDSDDEEDDYEEEEDTDSETDDKDSEDDGLWHHFNKRVAVYQPAKFCFTNIFNFYKASCNKPQGNLPSHFPLWFITWYLKAVDTIGNCEKQLPLK